MFPNEPHVKKPGAFQTWKHAIFFAVVFICVEALGAFIFVQWLTSDGRH